MPPAADASAPHLSHLLQESLDSQLAAVFGTADLNSGKTLSLTEFLTCLHLHQLQQIRSRPTMKGSSSSSGGGKQGGAGATSPGAAAIAAR
jgi:calmodulin